MAVYKSVVKRCYDATFVESRAGDAVPNAAVIFRWR
jgi:hypothetical protein